MRVLSLGSVGFFASPHTFDLPPDRRAALRLIAFSKEDSKESTKNVRAARDVKHAMLRVQASRQRYAEEVRLFECDQNQLEPEMREIMATRLKMQKDRHMSTQSKKGTNTQAHRMKYNHR